ncbi:Asparagine synthetase [Cupriavidus taiwanensis]|uniref:asparagine synthase (glutamine-hydrolyzing) n=1 Tax=Cupriavidus taiwanensis TaxID=164546 RepID=UPI000E180101|nr:asparagine synthase (glutamine-hydrolyzing) [Cupriavidus taiwanensis]SOY82786.1 Asparagine synthetase [Cupriavidus taiwanensis]SOY84546.1 Asparagine synthetase [Cupriavidus taiwanensis]
MCGIVGGFWKRPDQQLEKRLAAALAAMHHRGPNDRGFDLHPSAHGVVVLGHTRLSIIDLTSGGHQPMVSADERYAMVFNGEIYNYRELREELRSLGHVFRSDSDTEVLLSAWAQWQKKCLPRLEGMFAFVVHDRLENRLTFVRDAFGIKPLFYEQHGDRTYFASEHPALLALRGTRHELDWQRSYDYLVHGDYDSTERSFIAGVKHLAPGHLLETDLSSGTPGTPERWWRPDTRQHSKLSFIQAAEAVREQFLQNIRLHLRSDVALGAALSGGVDSSAVVCAMRHVEPDLPIHTFSYIAQGSDLSEESWADSINQHVGARPHKVTASADELYRDLDQMIQAQGEPFGSTSIYAQYRVFQLAREHGVTVTLDGQGADELLAGYSGYPGYRLLSLLGNGGPFAAHAFAREWSRWPGRSYRLACMELGRIVLPDQLYSSARKALGRDFAPPWLKVGMLADAGVALKESRSGLSVQGRGRRVMEQLAKSLQERGLPALLRHADRNAMRFSVESRVPFLTVPMANLLLSLPEEYLIAGNGETKSVFRAAMRGIVPDSVLDRKDKIGFATPERDWLMSLSSKLRVWLQDSHAIPFIHRDALLESFDAVMAGKARFTWQVWRWVNFVRWHATCC